jgi:hypothetical protein
MNNNYYIHGINGPVVKVHGGKDLAMMDQVFVGDAGLVGEVVSTDNTETIVQVYEDTAGLKQGEKVIPAVSRCPLILALDSSTIYLTASPARSGRLWTAPAHSSAAASTPCVGHGKEMGCDRHNKKR